MARWRRVAARGAAGSSSSSSGQPEATSKGSSQHAATHEFLAVARPLLHMQLLQMVRSRCCSCRLQVHARGLLQLLLLAVSCRSSSAHASPCEYTAACVQKPTRRQADGQAEAHTREQANISRMASRVLRLVLAAYLLRVADSLGVDAQQRLAVRLQQVGHAAGARGSQMCQWLRG